MLIFKYSHVPHNDISANHGWLYHGGLVRLHNKAKKFLSPSKIVAI